MYLMTKCCKYDAALFSRPRKTKQRILNLILQADASEDISVQVLHDHIFRSCSCYKSYTAEFCTR